MHLDMQLKNSVLYNSTKCSRFPLDQHLLQFKTKFMNVIYYLMTFSIYFYFIFRLTSIVDKFTTTDLPWMEYG